MTLNDYNNIRRIDLLLLKSYPTGDISPNLSCSHSSYATVYFYKFSMSALSTGNVSYYILCYLMLYYYKYDINVTINMLC